MTPRITVGLVGIEHRAADQSVLAKLPRHHSEADCIVERRCVVLAALSGLDVEVESYILARHLS
jgi:hypothetical protein